MVLLATYFSNKFFSMGNVETLSEIPYMVLIY